MIDFHCHLDLYPDPKAVIKECDRRGLYALSVTTTPSAWKQTNALAADCRRIRTALGLHPQLAHERRSELPLFEQLLPLTRYVGEVGLDGGPEFKAYWDDQVAVFTRVLELSRAVGGRVLSIHSRRASKPVLDLLERFAQNVTPILHWFSGSQRDLARAVKIGCWFSVGPAMLASTSGQKIAALLPRDRLLIESDGPFAQLGGRAIYPWEAELAVGQLATLWGNTDDTVRELLRNNLKRIALGPL
jgi:TatD DNase family protein